MKVSATALIVGATMAITSTMAIAETTKSDNNRGVVSTKVVTKQKTHGIKPAKVSSRKVSRKKVTRKKVLRKNVNRKRSSTRATTSRSARRGKYLPMARRLKPAGLPISLVDAVITMESGYNPSARGRHGEIGLMQVKPATARMVRSLTGVKAGSLTVPSNNLRVGMAYLNWCYKRAKLNVAATIGCYNAGPGNMWKWQKFAVTRKYVRFVRNRISSN